ncbi:putative UPF0481 protein [Sesbania bispinosa]|nr:putative UPF0481 protein [Sesbania bispinosa]
MGTCFIIIACCYCSGCGKNKSKTDYSRMAYAISLIFLSVFLIVTIIGSIFLYTSQGKFQSTADNALDVLVTRANTVVDIVHNVMTNLEAAKDIEFGQLNLPDEIKKNIGKVERLSNQTANIKSQTEETAKVSTELLNAMSQSLLAVTSLMLILAVIAFIISVFGWKLIVYLLVFIGWILVTCTFILGSMSLFVHNGVADTCVAMEDWLQHPQDHTALSKFLPCMDEATAQRTLDITKNTSFHMVNLVNTFVITVANNNVPPSNLHDIYYNQSGPSMPLLCNPFFPNLTERTCGPIEVDLKDAPTAYQSFMCNTSPSGLCITIGRLTPSLYTKKPLLKSVRKIALH